MPKRQAKRGKLKRRRSLKTANRKLKQPTQKPRRKIPRHFMDKDPFE